MTLINLLTLTVGILTLLGPIYVIQKNPSSNKNRLLMFMSFVTGPIWAISIVLFFNTKSSEVTHIMINCIYSVSIAIAILTFFFTKAFPYSIQSKLYEKVILYVPAVFLMYNLWFTENFVKHIQYIDGEKIPQFGYIYPIWVLWFGMIIGWRIAILGKNLRTITEIEKKQTLYLVVGLAISGLGMTPTNIVLPYLGIYEYIWIGPIMGSLMIALMSYGVSTLRFINLETIGKSAISFFGFAIFPSLIIGILALLALKKEITGNTFLIASLFSLLSYCLISFLKTKLISKRDPIENLSQDISTILNLNEISKQVSNFIKATLNPISLNIFLTDKSKKVVFQYSGNKSQEITNFSAIEFKAYFDYYNDKEKIIVLQELKHLQVQSIEEQNIWRYKRFLSLIEFLEKNHIEIMMPILLRDEFYLYLGLGSRAQKEMYVGDNIVFLLKTRNTLRVILERALLYQEVQTFNITLQHEVEEKTKELKQNIKELEEARKKESDMIDIMGHELRTPASIVKLNAEMMSKIENSNSPDIKKYLDRITDAIQNEIQLINTLLSSAKLEGDRIQFHFEKVDIKKEIEMSLHGFEKEAKEKGLTLENSTHLNTPCIYADKTRTNEILSNLIDNAIKYTDKGSIKIKTDLNGKYVKISVIDTGRGIPKEEIKKLGSKFHRLENYIDEKNNIVRPGGTGLGLYVTFNLIKHMGGSIDVKSEIGKGSTFTFTLPVYNKEKDKEKNSSENDLFTRLKLKK